MYSPTKWQTFKDWLRYIFCRHKHTQIRSVGGGMEGDEPEILGRFKYCFDCKNNISGWL